MFIAVRTGLEPATPCVTGMYSNQAELPHQNFNFHNLRLCNSLAAFPDCECKGSMVFCHMQIFADIFSVFLSDCLFCEPDWFEMPSVRYFCRYNKGVWLKFGYICTLLFYSRNREKIIGFIFDNMLGRLVGHGRGGMDKCRQCCGNNVVGSGKCGYCSA